MNISDSIGSFSDLYKKGLIKKGQFEAKIIDIVKSDIDSGVPLKAVEKYLLFFKKMLADSQIDEKLYDEISDLLLERCDVSGNSQETVTKNREKTSEIVKIDNSTGESINVEGALVVEEVRSDKKQRTNETDVPPKIVGSKQFGRQAYYEKGLKLIKLFQWDEGEKHIAIAAKMGHSPAKKYLKDNNPKANYLLKQNRKTREIGETESYLQSRKIIKSLDPHHHDKADVLLKDKNIKNAPKLGKTNNSTEVPSRGFFGKLVNGDYGLAKTYWLFGVLV